MSPEQKTNCFSTVGLESLLPDPPSERYSGVKIGLREGTGRRRACGGGGDGADTDPGRRDR